MERIPVRMAVSLPSSFCLISFPFRRHPLHGLNLVLVFLFVFVFLDRISLVTALAVLEL